MLLPASQRASNFVQYVDLLETIGGCTFNVPLACLEFRRNVELGGNSDRNVAWLSYRTRDGAISDTPAT